MPAIVADLATLLDGSDIRALVSIHCRRDGGEVLRRARASRSEVFRRSLAVMSQKRYS